MRQQPSPDYFEKLIDDFKNIHVAVIGDVMLDIYEHGIVERISPEAPVPVVRLQNKEIRPGGAANVALNIRSLGGKASLFSVIGHDKEATSLLQMLKKNDIGHSAVFQMEHRPTTTKTRIMAGNKQVLRLDKEINEAVEREFHEAILAEFEKQLDQFDVIIFQDYDKGVLDDFLIEAITNLCNKNNIPIAVDPKFRNFKQYKRVDLFKPNLKEAKEALDLKFEKIHIVELEEVALQLAKTQEIGSIMITLSEHGVFYSNDQDTGIWPAHLRKIADVSGAGDTVISVASLCLGLGLDLPMIAALSNLAGGLVCEEIGVVPLHSSHLLKEARKKLVQPGLHKPYSVKRSE